MAAGTTVVGVFPNRTEAERALGELRQAGLREDQLGLAVGPVPAAEPERDPPGHTGWDHAGDGAGMGTLVGACVTGVLTGTLAGMLPGAVVGGLLGVLIGLGIPAEEANHYERHFQAGRSLLTVQTVDRQEEVLTILRRCGATIGPGTPAR